MPSSPDPLPSNPTGLSGAPNPEALHQIFADTPAAICIQRGPEHLYAYLNAAYQQFFPDRLLLGRPVAEGLPETVASGVVALLDRVYETGETYYGYELPLLVAQPSGPPRQMYFTFTYQAYREQGVIVGISTVAYEVSAQVWARHALDGLNEELAVVNEELHAANEELTDSNERLLRSNIDLDTFVYAASHDLRQPITNLEGLLEILHADLPPPPRPGDVDRVLHLMQDALARFQRTLDHLTDTARLQVPAGVRAAAVALAPVLADVRQDLAPVLAATGGRLELEVPAAATLALPAQHLRSIAYNLLGNALKYRHPDRAPLVRVRFRSTPQHQVLEVLDNGLGIDLTSGRDVFALFERLHAHVDGSGVGLYMVKRMVENAKGRVEVQSSVGEGSLFSVYLPR